MTGNIAPYAYGDLTMLAIVILLLAVLAWAVFIYNRLVRLRNQVRTAWADIDVQLTRRHDLVPQLVSAVVAYASHESAVRDYNDATQRIPDVMVARGFGFDGAEFFQAGDGERAAPAVELRR